MMIKRIIQEEYFDWIKYKISLASPLDIPSVEYYNELLNYLDYTPFEWSMELDENRAYDGIGLRNKFGYECHHEDDEILQVFGDRPCSVLEMMAALAIRCEDSIMCDDDYGDRTGVWFWGMIENLGLIDMTDEDFDINKVSYAISNMLARRYSPNGVGGLFYVKHPREDLRNVDIWYQLMWYLSENY